MSNISDYVLTRDRRDSLVLLLACAAGSVDAIGYLGLDHVFTANMTGNTVLLGLALGQGHLLEVLRNLLALVGFALGVALGAWIVQAGGNLGDWDRRITWTVRLEAVALAAFTLLWHLLAQPRTPNGLHLLIVLSAAAMGLQSAAVRKLNLPGVSTTYVTGTVTSLVAGFVHRFRSTLRGDAAAQAVRDAIRWKHETRMQASVFVLYGVSAALSGYLQLHVPRLVALPALCAVLMVVVAVLFSKGPQPARA